MISCAGSSIANTLSGGIGADQLWGGTGAVADSLVGGAGADTFYFGFNEGDDVIAKEATVADLRYDAVQLSGINFADLTFGYSGGNDAVIGFAASTGYTGTLTIEEFISNTNTGRVNTFYAADKTFGLAIANSVGTNLTGTSYSDYMLGAAGNDTLTAGAGDSLFGGAGDDSMFYIATGGKFDGGAGTDTLSASTLTSAVDISLYDSTISNIEYLVGSSLGDILRGSTIANTLEGGIGADQLWGNQGDDSLIGGIGADTYWYGILDGSDTIVASDVTNNSVDKVMLNGVNYNQLTFARINGEADLQITIGGDTTNTLVLQTWGTQTNSQRVNAFMTADLTFGLALGQAAVATSLGGTSLADYIYMGSLNDTIAGSAGADSIYALAGDDSVDYRATAAIVDGGDGTDTITAAAATAAVDIDLRNVDATRTAFTSIEYVLGSSYNDTLRGTSLAETLAGGSGADAMWGAAGNDELAGGAGADTYWFGGGDGADTIATSTINNADYVNFSSINGVQIGGADISQSLSGNNLTITLTSGDSLTLVDWALSTGNKMNQFSFGANGIYSLSTDATTWTKVS